MISRLGDVPGKLFDELLEAAIPSTVVRAVARGAVGVIVSAAAVFAWCRERVRG